MKRSKWFVHIAGLLAWQYVYRLFFFLVIGVTSVQDLSCTKKDAPFVPTDSLGVINKWVYDTMQLYYYWSDEMPKRPDYSLPAQEFFASLLSVHDRFSWISNRMDIGGPPKTTIDQFGFHYALIDHPFIPQKLVGVVTFVAPGSTAYNSNLKRSMIFTRVNDQEITPQNKTATIQALNANSVVLQLSALNSNGHALDDSARTGLRNGFVPPKAVYATRTFQQNTLKCGYLAYYLCLEQEDANLLQRVQRLKNEGIRELILDLRYNPGGSVASAAKLAAAIVPAFNPQNIFLTYKGNRHGGTVKQSFQQTISFSGYGAGKDMSYLQSINLGLQRIYVLTSSVTASAAEALLNNLKPYIQVVQIGEKTFGKDEASFRLEDIRNPRQVEWLMMPTIYKITDANGNGNYSNGITPTHIVDEFTSLPLQQFGLPGDKSVDKALQLIYGTTAVTVTDL